MTDYHTQRKERIAEVRKIIEDRAKEDKFYSHILQIEKTNQFRFIEFVAQTDDDVQQKVAYICYLVETFDKVIVELFARSHKYKNNHYYRFVWYGDNNDNSPLSKMIFQGNRYTAMLKFDKLKPIIFNTMYFLINDQFPEEHGDDYKPSINQLVDGLVECLKDDYNENTHMIKMKTM